jgi:Flp pilus assembly protein TadD
MSDKDQNGWCKSGPAFCRGTRFSLALAGALLAAGCQSPIATPVGLTSGDPPTDEARLRPYVEAMGERYAANPDDRTVGLRYATGLRRLTQYAQAVAVLQRLAVKHPHDLEILAAYGKALVDDGRLQEAEGVLSHAHTPEHPDWSILSAEGSISDQLGNHTAAQAYYATALKIVPNQPQVLSNLGLSYALERRFPLAEATLRQAADQPSADMRVRQNLALVLAVEGKYSEAEAIARRDLSAIDAAENITTIRRTIDSSDAWRAVAKRAPRHSGPQTAANDETPSGSDRRDLDRSD